MKLALIAVVFMAAALPAFADGGCTQTDGQQGMWNGTTADDDGCTTPTEYAVMFSPDGLLQAGVIVGYTDAGNGNVTLDFGAGVVNTVKGAALKRVVAADGVNGPTVEEWFNRVAGPR